MEADKEDKEDTFYLYKLTDEREKAIWEHAIFVFDSSALLDFYFVPTHSRTSIFEKVFFQNLNRFWIPAHVKYEYLKNRENNIKKPIIEKYQPLRIEVNKVKEAFTKEVLKRIEVINKGTKKDDKHPFLKQTEIESFKQEVDHFLKRIDQFQKVVSEQIDEAEKDVALIEQRDDVLDMIEKYIAVGEDFSFKQILKITKEGKHRYEFKIPPGYGDLKKKEGTQIFGDLIIWKQILKYSKKEMLPIIFITNDITKDNDWCYIDSRDRVIMPREELIKEIFDFSGVDFWMYNLPQFLYNANKYLKSEIEVEAIENISHFLNRRDKEQEYLIFKCDECGMRNRYHMSDFNLDLSDFELTSSIEESMGASRTYEKVSEIECSECDNELQVHFDLEEYPEGVQNFDNIRLRGGKIIESFHFSVNFYDDPEPNVCQHCGGEFLSKLSDSGLCSQCEIEYGVEG